jgi:hypothetical protein
LIECDEKTQFTVDSLKPGLGGYRGVSLLDEFDKRTETSLRMDKGHRGSPASGPWCFVNRRGAGRDHRSKRLGTIGDAVADVMQAFAALFDGLGHRGVGSSRGEQLDVALCHLQQGLFHAVGFDDFPMLDMRAECPLVVVNRRFKVFDGNGNVVDLSKEHDVKLVGEAIVELAAPNQADRDATRKGLLGTAAVV